MFAVFHRLRIECFDLYSGFDKSFYASYRRRFANVIGSGLKGQSPDSECDVVGIFVVIANFFCETVLLCVICLLNGGGYSHGTILLISHMDQCSYVLGETASAVTESGKKKCASDPRIASDTASYAFDVGTEFIAKGTKFVHE